MPKLVQSKQYLPFIKGLFTEASMINFPEGATIDEDNLIISRQGIRERRLGLQVDSDSSWIQPLTSYNTCAEQTGNCTEIEPETSPCALDSILLCHFDSSLTDSTNNYTLTNNGGASIQFDTSNKQFGSGSLYFATSYGDGKNIALNNTLSIASNQDWTVDFWFKNDTGVTLWDIYVSSGYGVALFGQSSNQVCVFGTVDRADLSGVHNCTIGSGWHHIAIVNTQTPVTIGATGYRVLLFVDGVMSTSYVTGALQSNQALSIRYLGWDGKVGYALTGNLDEFHVTERACWLEDFTPPTSAYVLG